MTLPTDAQARKAVPVYSGVIKYFPRALAAVGNLSRVGNEQHNPGKPLFWDRSKSGDELDALTRHLLEAGTVDTDGVRHSVKVAWRALANAEKELEREEADALGYARQFGEDEKAETYTRFGQEQAARAASAGPIGVCTELETETETETKTVEVRAQPGLYHVHPDGSCTYTPTHPIGPAVLIDAAGRQISPTT